MAEQDARDSHRNGQDSSDESFEHRASNFEELASLVELLHSKVKKESDSQDVHRLIRVVQQSAKVLQPLGELVLGKEQYGDFLREFRHTLKFTDQSNEYGNAYYWAGDDSDLASILEKLREWDERAKLLVAGQLTKTENNGVHLKEPKELADRARKVVLAFRLSHKKEFDLQVTTDIRTLILSLRELGQDEKAKTLAIMFTSFSRAVSYGLHGEAIYDNESAEEEHDRLQKDEPEPDFDTSQSFLGGILYSVGVLLDKIELTNGEEKAAPIHATVYGENEGAYVWFMYGTVIPLNQADDMNEKFYFYRVDSTDLACRLCELFQKSQKELLAFGYTNIDALGDADIILADDSIEKYQKGEVVGINSNFFFMARRWEQRIRGEPELDENTGQQQLPTEKPAMAGKFVSVKELAEYYGIENKEALRKRMERFRKKNALNSDAFREVQNTGVRNARFLYNTEMVSGIIEELKRTQTSVKRPSKRKMRN